MGIALSNMRRHWLIVLTNSIQISRFLWVAPASTVLAIVLLARASGADHPVPTFNKEVAPILFKNCTNCHRPGEIASAESFLSYDTTRPWAESIKEQVLKREMPPWPADPNGSVKFRNDARLSQQEIDTLVAWVNAGASRGSDSDLPPAPTIVQGWLHPQGLAPDLVITLPEFQVPATGEIPYLRYLVKVPFPEDKWVAGLQVRPGNRAIVHHMAITELALADGVTPADLDTLAMVARQFGLSSRSIATKPAVAVPAYPAVYDMLGVYTPGTTFEMYKDGGAKLLKGGAKLVPQLQHPLPDDWEAGNGSVNACLLVSSEAAGTSAISGACRRRDYHRRRKAVADGCSGEEGRRHRCGDSPDSAVR